MLNTTQLTALRTLLLADANAQPFFQSPGNASGLRAYLNAATAYIVWRSKVLRSNIYGNGFDWPQVDNVTEPRWRIWRELFDNEDQSCNPSKAAVRSGIDEVWTGTAGKLAVRAQVYTHCKRPATRAEQLLATGTGSDAVPGLLGWEGEISDLDAARLIYRDDGTIWS